MRTSITTDSQGNVVLKYLDQMTGAERQRTFGCPRDGGYVLEWIGGEWKQVCDGLAATGSTLRCTSRADLAALIRRERRAQRARYSALLA